MIEVGVSHQDTDNLAGLRRRRLLSGTRET
jgi:hypothetical protein